MLGIKNNFLIICDQKLDRLPNHLKIFFESGMNDVRNLKIPSLTKNTDNLGISRKQTLQIGILGALNPLPAGRAKSDNLRVFKLKFFSLCKKFHVLRVRPRISRLNIAHPKLVQSLYDINFILNRVRDALALRTIPQSRIKNRNLFHKNLHGATLRVGLCVVPLLLHSSTPLRSFQNGYRRHSNP